MHLLKASSLKTKSTTITDHSPDHTRQVYVVCSTCLPVLGQMVRRYVGIRVHGRSEVDAKGLVQSLCLLIH